MNSNYYRYYFWEEKTGAPEGISIEDRLKYHAKSTRKNWWNTNALLKKGWEGVKTGQTGAAGSCLASLKKGIYIVVLNCKDNEARFNETEKIYEWYCSKKLEILEDDSDESLWMKSNVVNLIYISYLESIAGIARHPCHAAHHLEVGVPDPVWDDCAVVHSGCLDALHELPGFEPVGLRAPIQWFLESRVHQRFESVCIQFIARQCRHLNLSIYYHIFNSHGMSIIIIWFNNNVRTFQVHS